MQRIVAQPYKSSLYPVLDTMIAIAALVGLEEWRQKLREVLGKAPESYPGQKQMQNIIAGSFSLDLLIDRQSRIRLTKFNPFTYQHLLQYNNSSRISRRK